MEILGQYQSDETSIKIIERQQMQTLQSSQLSWNKAGKRTVLNQSGLFKTICGSQDYNHTVIRVHDALRWIKLQKVYRRQLE